MVRAAEDVAAHPPLLRGGEERPRAGGRAGQEGAAVQTPGKKLDCVQIYVNINSTDHCILCQTS